MGKATNFSQCQKSSTNPCTRRIPTTPVSEAMMPPAPQSMVSPTSGTSRPAETSMGRTYLRILGDVMERFSPNERMSEGFSRLAEELKEEENRTISTSVGTLNAELLVAEPVTLPHCTGATTDTQPFAPGEIDLNPRDEREAEPEEERESEERMHDKGEDEETLGRVAEVASVELDGGPSEEKEKAISEGTRRRSSSSQQGSDREELRSMREEATILAAAKREAAERKRKGKYVESPSKGKKPRPASLGVVIR